MGGLRRLQVGLSVNSYYDVAAPRAGVAAMLERVRAAERASLDSLFLGDHHATALPYFQNTPMLGRLLAEWGARTAGALYLLPLWHPVLLAEHTATLAAIARGPFVLQCALGPGDRQFEAFGVDPRHRPSRFEECLAIVRRLWAGEVVTVDGRYRTSRARIAPLPPDPIPVWIGGSAPPAIDRAARLGDGFIASPHLVPAEAERQLEFYRERCAAHGRPVGAAVIRRDVYVGQDAEEAARTAAPVVAAGYRGFDPAALIIGKVEQVATEMRRYAGYGYDHLLVRNLVPDNDRAVACLERLAEVKPLVAG